MSIDVTIRQKGIFQKRLPLEVILGETLQYGSFGDGLSLAPGRLGKDVLIAYDPAQPARGITVGWHPGALRQVTLRLLNPTTDREIRQFFDMTGRIAQFWHSEVQIESERQRLPLNETIIDGYIRSNRSFLSVMLQQTAGAENGPLCLNCALFPLHIGPKTAKMLLGQGHDGFANYLALQQKDAFYASPHVYQEPGTGRIVGFYALTEGVRSILPIDPDALLKIPGAEKIAVEEWSVFLCIDGRDAGGADRLPCIPYQTLWERIPAEKLRRFDAVCNLIERLTHEEMLALLGSGEGTV